jgi:ribonuclease Z
MDDVEGYSRALYSNWFWHKPTQLLVDAGEGLHLTLRTGVWQPNVVAITHGHSDHVLGLAGFAGARRFGKGATTKPWTVLYPEGSEGVAAARDLIASLWRGVEFPIEWKPVGPGHTHGLSMHRSIEAFAVQHVAGEPTLGYRVLERRRRLKPEFADRDSKEVERLSKTLGRSAVMDEYRHVILVHSGDAMPLDPGLARHADLLVHDATFLGSDERREPIHATTDEVFAVAREATVTALVLNHLSVRYDRSAALPRIQQQLTASGFTGACWLLDEGEFVPLRGALQ